MLVVLARGIARRLVERDDQRAARHELGQVLLQDARCRASAATRRWNALASRAHAGWSAACDRVVLVAQLPAQCRDSRRAWRWRRPVGSSAASSARRASKISRVSSRRGRGDHGAAIGPQHRRCDRARAPAAPCASPCVPTPNSSHSATSGKLGARRQPLVHHALEDRAVDARGVVLVGGRRAMPRLASTLMHGMPRRGKRCARDAQISPGVRDPDRAAHRARRAMCSSARAQVRAAGAAGPTSTDAARCPSPAAARCAIGSSISSKWSTIMSRERGARPSAVPTIIGMSLISCG